MNKIILWYSICNAGDGSAYLKWFLTREDAQYDQDNLDEGWGEPCLGSIDSYEGSTQHQEAIASSKDLSFKQILDKNKIVYFLSGKTMNIEDKEIQFYDNTVCFYSYDAENDAEDEEVRIDSIDWERMKG